MSFKNFNKDDIEIILRDFADEYKKLNAEECPLKIVLVGGASILLNYNFRESTKDIDYSNPTSPYIEEAIEKISKKYNINRGWLNNDLRKSSSYSDKLIDISDFYKNISDVLEVRTVKSEYLIAMKLMSSRSYKNDLSDIAGILWESKENNIILGKDDIEKAVNKLYGSIEKLPKKSKIMLNNLFKNNDYENDYIYLLKRENEAKKQYKKLEKDSLHDMIITDHNILIKKVNDLLDKKFIKDDNLFIEINNSINIDNEKKNIKNNIIEPMKCIKKDVIEGKRLEDVISKSGNLEKVEDLFSDKICKISKLKYENKNGKIIFALQRKRYNKSEVWHFDKDFNKESAFIFIKQFDENNEKKNNKYLINNNKSVKLK